MSITIRIKDNGPYLISVEDAASVVILDSTGERHEPEPGKSIALCRCGHSSRKPFCDRTHRTVGFQGALALPVAAPAPSPDPTAPMAVAPAVPAALDAPAAPPPGT